MKKFLSTIAFAGVGALALASCGSKETGTPITLWAAEEMKPLFEEQVKAFEEAEGVDIALTVEAVSESDAAGKVIQDIENAPDLYCFAQDQFSRLVQAGALQKLGGSAAETVKNANDNGSVGAATSGDTLYAYPLTSDNGYFMYYDKSIVKEADVDSLEKILKDCEDANKLFSMECHTSAWYIASWFFATGCISDWKTDDKGKFVSVADTFNSDKGLIAVKGMKKFTDSSAYNSSSSISDFKSGSAVVVSGTWAYADAVKAFEEMYGNSDNLGITDLPSFTVDGKDYHMGSYAGYKLLGVKPSEDPEKASLLNKLALYLTNEKCQTERFEKNSWGPSNKAAQATDAVKNAPALVALQKQNAYSTIQGNIHGSWWDLAKVIGTNVKAATDEAGLKQALADYQKTIEELFTLDPSVVRAFTCIGTLSGSTWDKDFEMVETAENSNIWVSKDAFTFDTKGEHDGRADCCYGEFKCRQGKSWDVAFGKDGGNFQVETAGTYKIKLTFNETDSTGVVELVAA